MILHIHNVKTTIMHFLPDYPVVSSCHSQFVVYLPLSVTKHI